MEYNGRGLGYETVLVNGEVALRQWYFDLRPWRWMMLAPHFAFHIPFGNVRVPATLDVRGDVSIRALRLYVAGVLVYSEGEW